MVKFVRFIACFIGINVCFISLNAQGYEIKIKIPALKDSSLVLGHHFASASALYPDDTIVLDKKGLGAFKSKKPLPGGMYVIFFPASKKYFDFFRSSNYINGEQQHIAYIDEQINNSYNNCASNHGDRNIS